MRNKATTDKDPGPLVVSLGPVYMYMYICICILIYICISVNIYIYTRDGDLYTCNITFFSALSIGRLLYPTSSPLCSIKLNGKEYGT